ncbi:MULTISPECIES: halocyanin domain-containing protein [Halobacterium]|uniref:halocyanin domain-containing protein n=1 Tax=Halobacterium TaxID=2239 RepID=UPI001E306D80|nr:MULTISPECIES: halocyanin domain-containing protein [Halobacterium]MCD2203920.1 halocyanin domain-containing protein [Halobacterium sp. KA-6]UHH26943.1 halocyanin domain-containing protein [Halobacterium noricense]
MSSSGNGGTTAAGRRAFLKRAALVTGAAAAGGTTGTVTAQEGQNYDGWLADTSNFNGTYDYTGQDQVTVWVGASGNGGNFAFAPAAIRVDPGTEVVWEWTGKGGTHNVVDNAGNFESDIYSQAGKTYSRTFESEGTYKYLCVPHQTFGMKGVVVVGGSGGLDPSEFEKPASASDSADGNGAGGDDSSNGGNGRPVSLEAALMVTSVAIAFLSPIMFGLFLMFDDSDDTAAAK